MHIYFDKLINTIYEFTFDKRLSYFMSYRGLTPEKIGEQCEDKESGKGNITRLIHMYKNSEIEKPKDETIVKLAEVLQINPDHLRSDLGKRLRMISIVENRLDNEPQFDFFAENRLYGNYEYSDFDCYNYLEESYISEDDILAKFETMEITECYKLIKYFDAYNKVNEHAWLFICNYSILNKKGKDKLKQLLFNFQTSIGFQLKNIDNILDNIKDFIELRKKINDTHIIQMNISEIWRDLTDRLSNLLPSDIERIYEEMDTITTMDCDDCNLLISYFLLTDNLPNVPSNKQELLLMLSRQLVNDEEYSDLLNKAINN